MNSLPTLILNENDEERTAVDCPVVDPEPRLAHEHRRSDGSGERRPRLNLGRINERIPWRIMAELVVVCAVCLVAGSTAYQQQRAAQALRASIDRLSSMSIPESSRVPEQKRAAKVEFAGRSTRPSPWELGEATRTRDELESLGARLIKANDFEGAIKHYERLTQLFPNVRAFRDIVTVLKSKLRCRPRSADAVEQCP